MAIERVAGGDDDQRVAVGRRLRQRFRGDDAAGAGAVLDHDRLAPALRQFVAERARHDVDRAAGRIWHQDADRARGEGVLGERTCGMMSSPH